MHPEEAPDQATSTEFMTTAEGTNEQLDKDDQAVAVEVRAIPPRVQKLIDTYPWRVRDDGVVVLQDEAQKTTKGGIHIANANERRRLSGYVIALGPGKRRDSGEVTAPDFRVGQRVFYSSYAGQTLDAGFGEEKDPLILLRLEDVRLVAK